MFIAFYCLRFLDVYRWFRGCQGTRIGDITAIEALDANVKEAGKLRSAAPAIVLRAES